MSNWKELPLNDVIELVIDHRGKTPKKLGFDDFFSEGYPVLSAKHVKTSGLVNLDAMRFANEEMYKKWMKEPTQKGDVILTSEAPLGELFYIDGSKKYVLGQRVFGLRPKSDVLDSMYLLVWLSSAEGQGRLQARATGSTVQGIKQSELLKIMISIPPMEVQKDIASIYGSLDQKIQLSTQINQTLEQIAQSLFKSWFVDFDPVRAKVQVLSDGLSLEQAELAAMQAISGKTPEELTALSQTQPERYAELAETAKAFPCEMVEVSNSIYIPKGWKIKYFNEIIDTYIDNRGKTPPIEKQGIPLLEVKHLPKNSVFPDLNTTKYISNDTYENWLRNKPEALDIMLSTVGTVGRVNLVPTNNKIAIAQNILGFRFNKEKATQIYMFYLMKSEKFIFDMEARVVETVQKSIKRKDLEKIPLLIPTLELQNLFSKFVIPFVIKQNNSENTNLEKIRNDLLPKLLSGEIQL